jgi:hypothetical protein
MTGSESAIQWIPVGIGVASGGLAGAFLNAAITHWRGRTQPVHVILSSTAIINATAVRPELAAKITVGSGPSAQAFESLWLIELDLSNRGNKDLDSFTFGVTFQGDDPCIGWGYESEDRLHKTEIAVAPSPVAPRCELDIALKPFNRKDIYKIRLYVAPKVAGREPERPKLGSIAPVKFVDSGTASDALSAALAKSSSFEVSLPFLKYSVKLLKP